MQFFSRLNQENSENKFNYSKVIPKFPNIQENLSFINIPSELVIDYLSKLRFEGSTKDDFRFLIEFLRTNVTKLPKWSVSLVNRNGNPSFQPEIHIGDTEIKKSKLQPKLKNEVLRFVAFLAREAGDTSFDIAVDTEEPILTEKAARDKRNAAGIPLLLVYPNECVNPRDSTTVKVPLIDVVVPNSPGLTKMEYRIRNNKTNESSF
jgi:hypothetical protein